MTARRTRTLLICLVALVAVGASTFAPAAMRSKKIDRNLSGIREMNRMPDVLVVVDPKKEHIAVQEAQRMGVTTVALIDTDSDPDTVDLPVWEANGNTSIG